MLEHNPLNQFMMLTKKIPPKKYILGTAFVILLIGLKNCFVIINPNERGLVINLGKLQEQTLDEGIHFVLPFTTKQAEEMVNKAKGEAEAQKLLQQTLTPALLQKQAIEKWNGQYPTVMGNNGTLPMLNIAPPVVKPSNP